VRFLDRTPARPVLRWAFVVLGLAAIVTGAVAAAAPFRAGLDYRRAYDCERTGGGCFGRERVTIVDLRTFVTVTRDEDGESRERVYEITWERPGGDRTVRRVSKKIFSVVARGRPADLRTWRGEVVGIEVEGVEQWFTPRTGWHLMGWLVLAWAGLGLVLWGLLVSWWDDLFMFAFRLFFWSFTGVMPMVMAMTTVLYGLPTGGELALLLGILAVFTGLPAVALWGTFRTR
jgi:hypothetical protein